MILKCLNKKCLRSTRPAHFPTSRCVVCTNSHRQQAKVKTNCSKLAEVYHIAEIIKKDQWCELYFRKNLWLMLFLFCVQNKLVLLNLFQVMAILRAENQSNLLTSEAWKVGNICTYRVR